MPISIRSDKGSSAHPILNGLEIFKLSDNSHNLAGPYPFGVIGHSHLNFSDIEDHSIKIDNRVAYGATQSCISRWLSSHSRDV